MRFGQHWTGYPPDDPPQGEHWCSECCQWDEACECELADETQFPAVGSGAATEHGCSVAAADISADEKQK